MTDASSAKSSGESTPSSTRPMRGVPGIERVVARADAPARAELVDALHVPAVLLGCGSRRRAPAPDSVERELAVLGAPHVLALQLERAAPGVPGGVST